MRVLLLSWEYPPRIVGGLGRHVYHLATTIAAKGQDIHVITKDYPGAPDYEFSEGVHIHRVVNYPPEIPQEEWVSWTLQFNVAVLEKAISIVNRYGDFDVIHAHDWLVAHAAAGLKHSYGMPIVSTIHATEYGRHQGNLPGAMNRLIHQVEWWLTFESERVICCSTYMLEQITRIFSLPPEKVEIIPNGIDCGRFTRDISIDLVRNRYVPAGDKLVFFVGRLVYEKGVQTVIEAMPIIHETMKNVTFIVAGDGPHADELKGLVSKHGLEEKVRFLGHMDTDGLISFYRCADLTVVPSLYEPFGMVVLESMALGTPTIVADTGGLAEIVTDEETGLTFEPGDPCELAKAVLRILNNPKLSERIVEDASTLIEDRYDWNHIASRTVEIYERAELLYEQRPRSFRTCPPIVDEQVNPR